MGWNDFWDDVGDSAESAGKAIGKGASDVQQWYKDTTDEGYSWFGIRSQGGNVQFSSPPPQPKISGWSDVSDPNLEGPNVAIQQWYPRKSGWSFEIGTEYFGAPGSLPSGEVFLCHPPDCVFDSLTMTMTNTDLNDAPSDVGAGFRCRLVQRTKDNKPIFVSGSATSSADDGTIYRTDLRLAAKSGLRALETIGGPVVTGLPMYVSLETYGDFSSITGLDYLQVQVTANLILEAVS